MWEIIDDEGVVYSGTQEEMERVFNRIVNGQIECDWTGDLKLIEIHNITR